MTATKSARDARVSSPSFIMSELILCRTPFQLATRKFPPNVLLNPSWSKEVKRQLPECLRAMACLESGVACGQEGTASAEPAQGRPGGALNPGCVLNDMREHGLGFKRRMQILRGQYVVRPLHFLPTCASAPCSSRQLWLCRTELGSWRLCQPVELGLTISS